MEGWSEIAKWDVKIPSDLEGLLFFLRFFGKQY